MKTPMPEPQLAVEVSFERAEDVQRSLLVHAICGYVDHIQPLPAEVMRPGENSPSHQVAFLDSSVEFASGWISYGEVDLDADHTFHWTSRQFLPESPDEFKARLNSDQAKARLMIIGTPAVEAFFVDLFDQQAENQTAAVLMSAMALGINRLRRSALSLDPSPAALGDIQYYLRTRANTKWAQEDPEEHAEYLQHAFDSIGWHAQRSMPKPDPVSVG